MIFFMTDCKLKGFSNIREISKIALKGRQYKERFRYAQF